MSLPPYDKFPGITSDKISLRQVQTSDIKDLIEISFYDSIQATTLQQASELQAKINKVYKKEVKSNHYQTGNRYRSQLYIKRK